MPINALHFFDRQPLLKITTHRTNIMLHASGAAAEIGLTYLVYFDHRFPLALALIPLIVAIALGTIWSRTTGMFSFLFWPVILSTIGLIGIELAAPLVWLGQASAKVQKRMFLGHQIAYFFCDHESAVGKFCRFRASCAENALRILLSGLFSHDRPRALAGRSHLAFTAMGVVKA